MFILEPSNYIYGLENLNENFKNCNSKKFEAIVKTSTIETYLKPLGININELSEDINGIYVNNSNLSRTNQKNKYREKLGSHAPQFYYEIDKDFFKYVSSHYSN